MIGRNGTVDMIRGCARPCVPARRVRTEHHHLPATPHRTAPLDAIPPRRPHLRTDLPVPTCIALSPQNEE